MLGCKQCSGYRLHKQFVTRSDTVRNRERGLKVFFSTALCQQCLPFHMGVAMKSMWYCLHVPDTQKLHQEAVPTVTVFTHGGLYQGDCWHFDHCKGHFKEGAKGILHRIFSE